MNDFDGRDFYMKWLYRIAYKFYVMNPWATRRYFDFSYLQYAQCGKKIRYILNFENYSAVSVSGENMPAKTIWLHMCGDDSEKIGDMKAFCCLFTPVSNIPSVYSEEIGKWKKQPFSNELTPFFVDFSAAMPKPLDFESSKQMYYLMNNTYCTLMSQKG